MSAVAGMKWSIQKPLPCSSGCPVGWVLPCAQLALMGMAGPGGALESSALALCFGLPTPTPAMAAVMLPAIWGGSWVWAPRLRNLLCPSWH